MKYIEKINFDYDTLDSIYNELNKNHKYIGIKKEEFESETFGRRLELYLKGYNSIKTEVCLPPLSRYIEMIEQGNQSTIEDVYETLKGFNEEAFYTEYEKLINPNINYKRLNELQALTIKALRINEEEVKETLTQKIRKLIKQ